MKTICETKAQTLRAISRSLRRLAGCSEETVCATWSGGVEHVLSSLGEKKLEWLEMLFENMRAHRHNGSFPE